MPHAGQINQQARVLTGADGRQRGAKAWEERPRETGERLGPGHVPKQLSATLATVGVSEQMRVVRDRAKELRKQGVYMPKDWTGGNLLSHIKASIELGVDWPLKETTRARLTQDMEKHQAAGGQADWWFAECENPTVTRFGPDAT